MLLPWLAQPSQALAASKIRELYNEGIGRKNILAFWVGEPDEPMSKGGVAPSFLDAMQSGDRIISTNTFSKAWLMTGWRLGWIVVPPSLVGDLGKIIEYNTSCTPIFVQRAGIAAITEGEPVIEHTLERFRRARDFLVAGLREMTKVEVAVPDGTMYVFLHVKGMTDSLAFCKRLVREHGLGLAPGSAFGPEGEGFLRWTLLPRSTNWPTASSACVRRSGTDSTAERRRL